MSAPGLTPRQAGEAARFDAQGFTATTMFEGARVRVVVAALEPGQEIPLHAAAVELVVTVAEGVGELLAGGRVYPMRAGAVAVVPAGETRWIRTRSARLVLVNIVTRSPSEADHARAAEVRWPEARATEGDPAGLIRAELAQLRPHLNHLRALADELEVGDERQLRTSLERTVTFLREAILSHAATEEATVYPVADRLLRALGGATGTMVIEHRLIAGRIAELEVLAAASPYDPATRAELRRSLTSVEAVLRSHLYKEDQEYVPLLAHLTADESDALAAQLRRAAPGGHEH